MADLDFTALKIKSDRLINLNIINETMQSTIRDAQQNIVNCRATIKGNNVEIRELQNELRPLIARTPGPKPKSKAQRKPRTKKVTEIKGNGPLTDAEIPVEEFDLREKK